MKPNPCYECICKPICRNKLWANTIVDCRILDDALGRRYDEKLFDDLRTKKFFDMEHIEKM